MKKRLIALAASVSLLIPFAGGCANQKEPVKLDPKNPVTVDIWHYYNGAQKTAFDHLITEFNETIGLEKGIIVEGINQGSINELTCSIIDSAQNKVGTDPVPNIFAAYADTAFQIDNLGLVADISPYISREEMDAYVVSYIEEGRLNGDSALKIFPTAKSTEVFMLNKTDWDKFSAATGASLEKLKTMEGLAETAEEYYTWTDSLTPDVPNDGKAFFGRDSMANYFIIGGKQLGCEIFSVKDGKVTFQLDEAVFRRLWDNYYVPFIKGCYAANGRFRSDDAKVGSILALVGSSTTATYFPTGIKNDTENYPIEALVLEAPVFSGAEKYAVQQGAGMVVTKSDPKEEYASVVFLKWFTETQRNLRFSVSSGYLPVKKEANDTKKLDAVLEDTEMKDISENLRGALHTSIETVNSYRLYTNKAFAGGTDARNVLEAALSDKAKEDRQAVVDLIAAGSSRQDAVSRYDTDENFQAWFQGLKQQLEAAVVE